MPVPTEERDRQNACMGGLLAFPFFCVFSFFSFLLLPSLLSFLSRDTADPILGRWIYSACVLHNRQVHTLENLKTQRGTCRAHGNDPTPRRFWCWRVWRASRRGEMEGKKVPRPALPHAALCIYIWLMQGRYGCMCVVKWVKSDEGSEVRERGARCWPDLAGCTTTGHCLYI